MFRLRSSLKLASSRWVSSVPSSNVIEHLKHRGLLKVSGAEVSDFLQGLITNDIRHLTQGVGSMYSLFLNTKGRVMYDTIIYRTSEENSFLLECDKQAIGPLQKHLKLYRVRRKIDILEHEFDVYVVFNPEKALQQTTEELATNKCQGLIVPCTSLKDTLPETSSTCKMYRDLLIYSDPRIADLGFRILLPPKLDAFSQISEVFNINKSTLHSYCWFRYKLGVGEGINDLPPGNCFPLEANCDYLHGVSFHKGCYIGQELTARTHHTGVVRKRLMPLFFSTTPQKLPENDTIIHENVNLGKLRGIEGDAGLALLRIAKAIEFNSISVGTGMASTKKPLWWPLEAPKERVSIQKG